MLSRPRSIWSVLGIVALVAAGVFVAAGYGMILLPMGFILFALMLGAAGAMFGSR
jgi:hypothetical protein